MRQNAVYIHCHSANNPQKPYKEISGFRVKDTISRFEVEAEYRSEGLLADQQAVELLRLTGILRYHRNIQYVQGRSRVM